MNTKQFFTTALVAILVSAATFFALDTFRGEIPITNNSNSGNPYQFANMSFPVAPSGMAPVDFTYAAAISTPAVVHVKTTYNRNATNANNDVMKQFFGNDFFWDDGSLRSQEASGSGVIVDADGYIVTNFHVVKNADDIQVVLYDNRTLSAELIGSDPSTDIALLKIAEKDLPTIQYGNSDSLRVGEWVLAVGNPFDLASTVTAGIVSAKGRNINILGENTSAPVESFIQTDAAVNPGNSGGALVGIDGRLIGINTAIATPTGTFAGYSFAVPVNIVKKVVSDIRNYGMVQRAYIGVEVDVTKQDLGGVFVSGVLPNSGADKAGIQAGDIITHINTAPITSFPALQEQISKYGPGDKVNVDLLRNKERENVIVTLKNKEGNTDIIVKETNVNFDNLGIETEEISSKEASYYQLSGGVRVTGIKNGFISQQTRIRSGFIITGIDGVSIKDNNELVKALKDKTGKSIIIEGIYPAYPNKIYNYGLSL
ncbi:MAG: trypsin-like peptidase domain-containing protein [Chitinophagales bacterium]|nr:trypsin-like peptidase domain-containing protein [Bacteroidota bacterium]MBK8681859.1 trypsin-like peptidase domain-containing protein [Bacteroidota bacterium]